MNASAEIREAIVAADGKFMSTYSRGDAAGMGQLYTESGQLMPPNSDFITGREGVQACFQAFMGMGIEGIKLEAIEVEERIAVPREMVRRREESFALRVRGDSMIEEHICDGDTIVVESRSEARNGETVVALIRGSEATLKKFYRRGAKVVLEPANQALRPIEVPASEVQIRGVVRGLLRVY